MARPLALDKDVEKRRWVLIKSILFPVLKFRETLMDDGWHGHFAEKLYFKLSRGEEGCEQQQNN